MSQPPYGSNWPPEEGGEQPDPDATQRSPDSGTEQQPDWGATQEWGATQQQPDWGATQQQPDWGPTQQQPGYGGPQYPSPTQPLPPYQPPAPPPGQWGRPPPGPPGPPYQPPYPPGPPWGQPPRRRNKTLIIVLAIVGLLAVGGAVTGVILATSSDNKHDTAQTGTTLPTGLTNAPPPTGGTSPDFPTSDTGLPTNGPTDFPTESAGGGTGDAVKVVIAHNAETVLHGLGNDQPSAFCPLIDPNDLQRLLKEKHLNQCSDIRLTDATNKTEYQTYSVTNPSEITISGNSAEIPGDAGSPSDVGTVDMRKDADGNWKFRFYQ